VLLSILRTTKVQNIVLKEFLIWPAPQCKIPAISISEAEHKK
jgi:hypothetical protein